MSRSSSSTDPVNLLEVGRIDKPHGVRGDVVVALTTTEKGRVAPGTRLFSGDREFLITASRPHQHRWIVAFEGVFGREDELRHAIDSIRNHNDWYLVS